VNRPKEGASALTDVPGWLSDAVSAFGVTCAEKLAGPGDKEAAIRAPLEGLLGAAGVALKVKAAFLDKPYFRETLTQHIGEEFYKTIRTNAGQRG